MNMYILKFKQLKYHADRLQIKFNNTDFCLAMLWLNLSWIFGAVILFYLDISLSLKKLISICVVKWTTATWRLDSSSILCAHMAQDRKKM